MCDGHWRVLRAPAVIAWFVFGGSLICWGQASTIPYAQMLVNQTLLRHPEVSSLSITAADPTTNQTKVIASNEGEDIGKVATSDMGQPASNTDTKNQRCHATIDLRDAPGNAIGSLTLGFKSEEPCVGKAQKIGDELQEVIPSRQDLFNPFIVSTSPDDVLAQRLTIQTLQRYPDLLVLAFHVTAPGESVNRVVGINQPKFLGRASDDVDHEVAKSGKMIVQVIPATHRMEVHMPLRASDRSLVGTLVTVYLWQNEAQAPELIARSMKIRNELQSQIPDLPSLLESHTDARGGTSHRTH
jgi:hypothetical protein